ncbi:MAG: hypothetical protein ABJH48_01675, partial [Parasphingorhabdus sp.]
MTLSPEKISTCLEIKADPLEASFDATTQAAHPSEQDNAIAGLRTDVDGLKSQMADISRASARPVLDG